METVLEGDLVKVTHLLASVPAFQTQRGLIPEPSAKSCSIL